MSEETATCRNCGSELPLEQLNKVGSGRYKRWTGLWSCHSKIKCKKAQKELTERAAAQRQKEFEEECAREEKEFGCSQERLRSSLEHFRKQRQQNEVEK